MLFYRALSLLPLWALYVLSAVIFPLVYYVFRYRRAVVGDNLRHAFPELDGKQRKQIEVKFYRQLLDVAAEIIRAQRMSLEEFRNRVQVENPELLRHLRQDGHGSILVLTLHQGNWEWMLHATNAALGEPMDPVYKPLHNHSANTLMHTVRSRFGARPLALKSAARDILRMHDENRLLTMVADQSPTRREKGLWTEFLHRPAAFHTGAESLARRAGFPVVFARCKRLRRGYYALQFSPITTTPREEADGAITLRYAALAEQAIREEPESWLWSNRRWKRSPETEQVEG